MSSVRHRLGRLEARSGRPTLFVANPWTIGEDLTDEDIRRHQEALRQALLNPKGRVVVLGAGERDPFNVRPMLAPRR